MDFSVVFYAAYFLCLVACFPCYWFACQHNQGKYVNHFFSRDCITRGFGWSTKIDYRLHSHVCIVCITMNSIQDVGVLHTHSKNKGATPLLYFGYKKMSSISWLTYGSLVYEPNAGGGRVAGSQPMGKAVQLHRSPNKLWRSDSIFNLCPKPFCDWLMVRLLTT